MRSSADSRINVMWARAREEKLKVYAVETRTK